ncbi:hypothetical protein U9M48_022665 [Paspalum notatum var. saurae]|uniref:Glycosyltransferase N-terminal domain-containing protein n=1 Tax=Paspalum notatum var. saurae TaxID=547442 RepID=A0AAQ3WV14_PASNO
MGAEPEPEPMPVPVCLAVSVVLVPFPAQGHVSPMLRLARALAARGVAATVAMPDFVHRRIVRAGGQQASVGVELASIHSGVPDDGKGDPPGFASFAHAMEHHMPVSLEEMLTARRRSLTGRSVACLVADVLASWAIPVADRCGVPVVGFWTAMLATYRVVAAIPELIEKGLISDCELDLSTADLPWLVGDVACQKSRFTFWLRTMKRAKNLRSSILINSFPDESAGGGDSAGNTPSQVLPHVLQVGPLPSNGGFDCSTKCDLLHDPPLAKNPSMWQADETCLEWLDQQRPGSVIYVSFGSWVPSIGGDVINELALGLQATGRPFLWALKEEPSWRDGLPKQYAESVAGRGKIVAWAPQEDVLRHNATGCFLTHCGWNSTLEAIQHGVRLLCYPVSGDQFINCAYIVKMWEMGMRLWSTKRGVVEDCVTRIMEGAEGRRMQEKMDELRERVIMGDARCAAKRNLDSFVDGIIIRDEPSQTLPFMVAADPKPAVPVRPTPAIVLVPFPAQGHISPMLSLARALAARGAAATVAVPDFVHRRIIGGVGVELVSLDSGIPDDGNGEPPGFASIAYAMEHHLPVSLEEMLMTRRGVACVVADILASWAFPVATRCGVPAAGFWAVMLAAYRVVAAIPELIDKGLISDSGIPISTKRTNNGEDKVNNGDCQIGDNLDVLPAELQLSTAELPWLVGDAACQKSRFNFWLQTMERAKNLRSILVNTFPGEAAGDSGCCNPPSQVLQVLQVGPSVWHDAPPAENTSMWQADETCLHWLDKQRDGSVMYVSFGSWVPSIGRDVINEIALSLQATGRPFLWALKEEPSWRDGLPKEYAEAVAGHGKIVAWAPQDDVLRHKAIGCYLTHCGWNSTLEAIQHGVRLLCYPVSGDQFINCAYIVKMWETGMRLWSTKRGVVEDCVTRIMEGDEGRRMQEKVNELRQRVMMGEARCAAKRNLDSFVDGIIMRDERIVFG